MYEELLAIITIQQRLQMGFGSSHLVYEFQRLFVYIREQKHQKKLPLHYFQLARFLPNQLAELY